MVTASEVLTFWFEEISPKLWFAKDLDFDDEIRRRFSSIHSQAARGETFFWRTSAEGRLAEVIVLDQFSRNMFRDRPESFAYDIPALFLAQEAVAQGADQKLDLARGKFFYMPYMHSESLVIHHEALRLFSQKGLEENLDFEIRHQKILERFGRYPHRNAILGRASTAEEKEFLTLPGSGF